MERSTAFVPPEGHGFIYLGITTDRPQRAPVYRWTRARRDRADRVVAAAERLERRPDVASVRVFRARIVPPLPGSPRHDIAVLVRTAGVSDLDRVRAADEVAELEGEEILVGENAARIGDTENDTDATFLLNHFTVDGDDADPVEVWKGLTAWYTSRMRVDNSTALSALRPSAIRLVNYVRIPSSPPVFLVGQLVRPSFHRVVRGALRRNGMRALPGFYTLIR